MIRTVAVTLLALTAGALAVAEEPAALAFETDLTKALERARAEKKPVFVYVEDSI